MFSESVSSVIPSHVEIGTSLISRIMLIVPCAITTVSSNDDSRDPQKNANCFLVGSKLLSVLFKFLAFDFKVSLSKVESYIFFSHK